MAYLQQLLPTLILNSWSIYVKNDCTETFIILFVLFILAAWVFHTERPVSHTDVFKANLSYLS